MAAFFLFPRDFFAELLDFYRLQNAWVYLYILSLFAFRLFIGQAIFGDGERKNSSPNAGKAYLHRDAREILRPCVRPS